MEGSATTAGIDHDVLGEGLNIDAHERRFFDQLGALLGSSVRGLRRLGPQVVYLSLADGRELIHKEVPRQDRPTWRPGAPWTELVWIDYLAAEGLPVPELVAADVQHGWMVQAFVPGRLLSEGVDGPTFVRLLRSLLRVESACERAPHDVRTFSVQGMEADLEYERRQIEKWVTDETASALSSLIDDGFGGARPPIGPLDIRSENALDLGDEVVLIDFASVGADFTERRLAGYIWTALPTPRSFLTEAHFSAIEGTLGRRAALRLAFFDFAYCARALDRRLGPKPSEHQYGPSSSGIIERLQREWERARIDDERVIAVQRGLRLNGRGHE